MHSLHFFSIKSCDRCVLWTFLKAYSCQEFFPGSLTLLRRASPLPHSWHSSTCNGFLLLLRGRIHFQMGKATPQGVLHRLLTLVHFYQSYEIKRLNAAAYGAALVPMSTVLGVSSSWPPVWSQLLHPVK